VWNHLDGRIKDFLPKSRTPQDLRDHIHKTKEAMGTVVDSFTDGKRIYATVELNPGTRIPKAISNWMESSISDICIPSSDGKTKTDPVPVELSGTNKGAREGCRIVDQLEPRAFRQKIGMDPLASFTPAQQEAWKKATADIRAGPAMKSLLDSFQGTAEMEKLFKATQGLDEHIAAAILAAIKLEETAAAAAAATTPAAPAAPAAAPAAPTTGGVPEIKGEQYYKKMAEEFAAREIASKYGVSQKVIQDYINDVGVNSVPQMHAVLTECSARAVEMAKKRSSSSPTPDEPERQRRRVDPPASEEESNLARLQRNTQMIRTYVGY